MYAVSTLIRHCEAQLMACSRFTQLGTASSPKQSPCTDFRVKRFFDDSKNSCQLIGEGRLLRRLPSGKSMLTLLLFISFHNAPRNDEGKDRKVFGGVKENLLEGYSQ
jgi:hypothetical protein